MGLDQGEQRMPSRASSFATAKVTSRRPGTAGGLLCANSDLDRPARPGALDRPGRSTSASDDATACCVTVASDRTLACPSVRECLSSTRGLWAFPARLAAWRHSLARRAGADQARGSSGGDMRGIVSSKSRRKPGSARAQPAKPRQERSPSLAVTSVRSELGRSLVVAVSHDRLTGVSATVRVVQISELIPAESVSMPRRRRRFCSSAWKVPRSPIALLMICPHGRLGGTL
jgi:hypothetical protein